MRVVAFDTFDKTGTLTRGVPEVTNVVFREAGAGPGPVSMEELLALELLALAAGVERLSGHPLAQAVLRHAEVAYALQLARRNLAVVRQNLALSALVIGTLVAGAIAGALSLPVAVLGHELSEFVVIASGLRMLRA